MELSNKNEAFMRMYQPVHSRLCRYVQSLVWQPEDARDLIGEVTLQAFEKFEATQDEESFIYFLFGIARNLYLKKCRRDKWKGFWHPEKIEEKPAWQEADSSLKRRELALLLSKLSEKHRTAITLFEIAGFSYEEIARLMNTTSGNVKSMLSRARESLREFVELENKRTDLVSKSTIEAQISQEGGVA